MTTHLVPDTDAATLPDGYLDLAPFLDWALETENERYAKKLAMTVDETRPLYDALAPRMNAIITLLGQIPRSEPLTVQQRNLYLLALSFIEVSMPIELEWRETRNDASYPGTRIHRPHRP